MSGEPGAAPPDELPGGFSRRIVGWMVAVAVVSLLALVLLAAYGQDLSRPPNPYPNSWSTSSLGYRAVVELLEKRGVDVLPRRLRTGLGTGPDRPLVLAEPQPARVRADATHRLGALRAEALRRGAPLVVVLPKWSGRPSAEKPGWIDRAGLLPAGEVAEVLAGLEDPALHGLTVRRVESSGALTCQTTGSLEQSVGGQVAIELAPVAQLLVASPELRPVVTCTGGLLVASRDLGPKGPELLLIADPDLLNNRGLGRADHARLAYALLVTRYAAQGLVFDETIHGFDHQAGLLAEALRFPLVLPLLQSLLVVGLGLWAGARRFGKPLPAPSALPPGKGVLIDNTAHLLAAGGHVGDSLARYYRQTMRAVAAQCFLPSDLPESELLGRLQQIADARGVELPLATLETQVRRLVAAGRREATAAAGVAWRLYRFRLEMTRGPREGA